METRVIRVGNQTSCHTLPNLPFEFALRHGFDAFEWFSDRGRAGWGEDDVSPTERERLRRISQERDVLFSVHAPSTADPTAREGADALRRSIRFAGEVGADVVNLHLLSDHGAEAFAECLGPLLEAAAVVGVRLSLENTPQTSPDDFNATFGVLSRMPEAAGRVGMCFDMGHANLFAGTRNNYLRFVDLLRDDMAIIHWHAHENWGDRDSHLTLFTGPSARDDRGVRGLARRLMRRGFCGTVVLEQWPCPPEQLIGVRKRLQSLLLATDLA